MRWTLDENSPEPIYLQLTRQVKYAVATGELRQGERLPSVRKLALQLRINPNTVARAYRDLEQERIVETRAGSGVRVSGAASIIENAERERIVREHLRKALTEAFHLDLDAARVKELFKEILAEFEWVFPNRKQ